MPAIKPGGIIPTNWLSKAVFYVDIMLSDQGFSLFDIRFRLSEFTDFTNSDNQRTTHVSPFSPVCFNGSEP
jgi:hypothetical protein